MQTLEEIRDCLITNSRMQKEDQRAGYVNGILDFYNEIKKQEKTPTKRSGEMDILVPLNKKVVVEPEAKKEKSKGGIIIPQTTNQKAPTKGRLVAIDTDSGINRYLKVGDLVLFSKFAGSEVVIPALEPEGKDRHLLIMKDEDILAKVEERDG